MSGHAILDSCHNCGKERVPLFVVSVSTDSSACVEDSVELSPYVYHHIHVTVACADCKRDIWNKE